MLYCPDRWFRVIFSCSHSEKNEERLLEVYYVDDSEWIVLQQEISIIIWETKSLS